MKSKRLRRLTSGSLILCGLLLNGCGKKKETAVLPDGEAEISSEGADQNPGTLEATVSTGNRNLAKAKEALEIGQYNKAARELLQMKLAGRIRTTEESWRYNQMMTDLQSRLADAAADGDAESQRTMEMLRAASSAR